MKKHIKKVGSKHYKTGDIEPIDLMKSGNMLRNFALGNIIKYAFRNNNPKKDIKKSDMEKIKHYADMLLDLEDCK